MRHGAAAGALAAVFVAGTPAAVLAQGSDPSVGWQRGALVTGAVFAVAAVAVLAYAVRTRRSRRLWWTAGGCAAVALGLLGGPSAVQAVQLARCDGRPTTAAELIVVSPSQGQVFDSTQVPVEVQVVGGRIGPAETTDHKHGTGHIRIAVDGALQAMVGEARQNVEVPEGTHDIKIEYAAGDHGPFCNPVTVTRRVEVKP